MGQGINKVILIGNLGVDPELRYTTGGTAVCDMRLAVSRSYKTNDGERQEETEWVSLVVWGGHGEICSKHLCKGSQLYVEGRLHTRKWQDREGNDRYTTEVVVEQSQFLQRAAVGADRPAQPAADRPAPTADDEELPF